MEPEVQRKVRRPAKRNIVLISLLVFILLMLAVSGQFIYTLAKHDKVYAGVNINGTNVGGFTKSELESYLNSHYDNKVGSLNVVLKAGNKELKSTYNELGVQYDVKAAVKEAYAIGRNGNLPFRLYEIFTANKSGKNISMFWDNYNKFLENGIGFCTLHDNEVVCVCQSAVNVAGISEIDIFTSDKFRNLGLATHTCSAFIDYCLVTGTAPDWDCVEINQPSYNLAKKLGFEELQKYPLYVWHKDF